MNSTALLFLAATLLGAPAHAQTRWPDLSRPVSSVGGGSKDAALLIGIEDYAFVSDVQGAGKNILAWYDYLTKTLKVPPNRIELLRDSDGTREEIEAAAEKAAKAAGPEGTLWVVFIGHGAPSKDGKDGVLIGADAQQKATSLYARSLPQKQLLELLKQSEAANIHIILDACFSGRQSEGAPLIAGLQPLIVAQTPGARDPRMVIATAAEGDQFAGPLPGDKRPAFSYLALGALRGWGDMDGDGQVTASEMVSYTKRGLQSTLRGREQTPTLRGDGERTIAPSGKEGEPDLDEIAKATNLGTPKAVPDSAPASSEGRGDKGRGGIAWVTLSGGEFVMGSGEGGVKNRNVVARLFSGSEGAAGALRETDQKPAHKVQLASFQLAKKEVTNRQYNACVEEGTCQPAICPRGSEDPSTDPDDPVVCVTWEQARRFSEWVGGRLPSEAEWEYAARSGGKPVLYPWGSESPDCRRAVMSKGRVGGCGRESTAPGCSKPLGNTDQGLCDMAGNAWEWVQDWYHSSYKNAPTDGSAWESPATSRRVVRGGGWTSATYLRTTYRESQNPEKSYTDVGFRPAHDLE
ncbi:MAG TPA: hypothetical protein DCM05_09490 [Elusimicrobia bacterium]|nr:hypothetical protein [Elusimicrobiota bacterium]